MAKKSSRKSASGKAPRARRAAKKETPPAPAPSADAAAPAHADISARAHAIWIARGRPKPGTPLEDWLQAERELSAARR